MLLYVVLVIIFALFVPSILDIVGCSLLVHWFFLHWGLDFFLGWYWSFRNSFIINRFQNSFFSCRFFRRVCYLLLYRYLVHVIIIVPIVPIIRDILGCSFLDRWFFLWWGLNFFICGYRSFLNSFIIKSFLNSFVGCRFLRRVCYLLLYWYINWLFCRCIRALLSSIYICFFDWHCQNFCCYTIWLFGFRAWSFISLWGFSLLNSRLISVTSNNLAIFSSLVRVYIHDLFSLFILLFNWWCNNRNVSDSYWELLRRLISDHRFFILIIFNDCLQFDRIC